MIFIYSKRFFAFKFYKSSPRFQRVMLDILPVELFKRSSNWNSVFWQLSYFAQFFAIQGLDTMESTFWTSS